MWYVRMVDGRLAEVWNVPLDRADNDRYMAVGAGALAGVRLEQGDTGDGLISRHAVAQAMVAALSTPAALGKTFEIYDEPGALDPNWPALGAGLLPDGEHLDAR
jgi:hypothetical protein